MSERTRSREFIVCHFVAKGTKTSLSPAVVEWMFSTQKRKSPYSKGVNNNTRATTSGAMTLGRVHQLIVDMQQGWLRHADVLEESFTEGAEGLFQDGYLHAKGVGAVVMTINATVAQYAAASPLRGQLMNECNAILDVKFEDSVPELIRQQARLLDPVLETLGKMQKHLSQVAIAGIDNGDVVVHSKDIEGLLDT
jgi:hypothetical protein